MYILVSKLVPYFPSFDSASNMFVGSFLTYKSNRYLENFKKIPLKLFYTKEVFLLKFFYFLPSILLDFLTLMCFPAFDFASLFSLTYFSNTKFATTTTIIML